MLLKRDFAGLANRFGYALAWDRTIVEAIETDFWRAAAAPNWIASGARQSIEVKYFSPNATGLFALIECIVPVAENAAVLLELIVTGGGDEKHITVEDISGTAG